MNFKKTALLLRRYFLFFKWFSLTACLPQSMQFLLKVNSFQVATLNTLNIESNNVSLSLCDNLPNIERTNKNRRQIHQQLSLYQVFACSSYSWVAFFFFFLLFFLFCFSLASFSSCLPSVKSEDVKTVTFVR